MSVIAVCSLKSGGSSTLALTLASVEEASGQEVALIDASRNGDLTRWGLLPSRPRGIEVLSCDTVEEMGSQVRAARARGTKIIIDAGTRRDRIKSASRFADLTLVPLLFSPLSAYWATETDRLLGREVGMDASRRHAFVATAIAQIPSRVARAVERGLEASRAARLPAGLALRAAFEAPFLSGGTIFSLSADAAPGLDKARADALAVAREIEALLRQTAVALHPAQLEVDGPSWRGLALSEFGPREPRFQPRLPRLEYA